MGVILAIGLTELWPITIALALFYFYWKRASLHINISRSVIALWAILLASSLWSPTYSAFYYVATFGIAAVILAHPPRGKQLWIPIYTLVTIQVVYSTVEYLSGATRIHGLSQNASVLGLSGLAIPTSLVGALLIGVSLSRTALIGMALFAILRNHRIVWLLLAVTIVLHVSISFTVNPARITPNGIVASTELRTQAITGTSTELPPPIILHPPVTLPILTTGENTEPVASKCGERRERQLHLFGYGYGGYCLSTGQIQPHNIYVLSVWELGILAVPFWALIILLLRRSRNPYLLIFVPLSLIVDEWYTHEEGIYIVALFHLLTRDLPSPVDNWRSQVHTSTQWLRGATGWLWGGDAAPESNTSKE